MTQYFNNEEVLSIDNAYFKEQNGFYYKKGIILIEHCSEKYILQRDCVC